MSETQDLNRQIAVALGYDVIFHAGHYEVVIPNSDAGRTSFYTNEADAWRAVTGDWEHSVDAALTLPIGPKAHWLFNQRGTWHALITDTELHGRYHFDAASTALAEAICRAWLAYRKATKK